MKRLTTYDSQKGVQVRLCPIERQNLLALTRDSAADLERRLFWKLVVIDNGAPDAGILFTPEEVAYFRHAIAAEVGVPPRLMQFVQALAAAE